MKASKGWSNVEMGAKGRRRQVKAGATWRWGQRGEEGK